MSEKLVFEKITSRDSPLLLNEAFHRSYVSGLKSQVGFDYPEVLMEHARGRVCVYRPPLVHFERLLDFLIRRLEDEPELIEKTAARGRLVFSKFLELDEEMAGNGVCLLSNSQLAGMTSRFVGLLLEITPVHIINKWFPVQMERHSARLKWEKQVQTAMQTREETERFGVLTEKIGEEIAQEASKRMFQTQEYANVLTCSEITAFLLTGAKPSEQELQKRLNGFVYGNLGIKFVSVSEYAHLEGFEIKQVNTQGISQVTGQVAFKGVAQGTARVILSKNDISLVQEGEILVAAQTSPDYMLALSKVVAFVTDEGGITCHAAIVSRELKKPCVIGTKIATSIIKTGDFIEVNADIGLVRVLRAKK